ncbi:hypothetical protein F4801DRAFT_281472 [Xylaria longipes]|nr:hypothetical protein F4801DRAFT_281472 [Xylaria longipes]
MLSHDSKQTQQASGRRRRGAGNITFKHAFSHCRRIFKRSEHLEHHVQTHTKEKPFICPYGASFTRRDLLTRHQRITAHETSTKGFDGGQSSTNPDVAVTNAAASLSSMSTWAQQSQHINNQLPIDHPSGSTFNQPILDQAIF